jgi:hypothetical protein
MDRASTIFLKLLFLPCGLYILFPTVCQKSWSHYIQKRWKRVYQRITGQLTTSYRFFVMYFFLVCKLHCHCSEFCHPVSFSMEPFLPLCPNQALLLQNAMLYRLENNLEVWCFWVLHQKHFHLYSQGERMCLLLNTRWFFLVMTCQEI